MTPRLMKLQQIEIQRPEKGELVYEKGRPVPPQFTVLPMKASVQPADADKISQLPEGDRGTSVVAVYSTEPLMKRDRFLHGGIWYSVLLAADWNIPTLRCSHYMALATSEDFTK